jgi:hypothetical protein
MVSNHYFNLTILNILHFNHFNCPLLLHIVFTQAVPSKWTTLQVVDVAIPTPTVHPHREKRRAIVKEGMNPS